MMDATLRYGSSYFWRVPIMLCGTAITYSMPCVSHNSRVVSSDAYFAMPYGSCGFGVMSSVNGTRSCVPYRAMLEQSTNRFTLFAIAADKTETVLPYVFCVMRCGENTDKPSY